MKVIFWGNVHGQSGTSSNMLATAMMNDLLFRTKSILLQTEFDMNELEISLLPESFRKQIQTYPIGMDRLIQGIRSGMNAKQLLVSSCITLSKQCIDFLPGTNTKYREIYEEQIKNNFCQILSLAQQCYEMVFVDVSVGKPELMEAVVKQADIVVVNLCQNRRVIEEFFHRYEDDEQKVVYLIGNYDPYSELNVKAICHRYRQIKKDRIFVVPYNTGFRDATYKAQLSEFFLQNMACEPEDENYHFIQEIKHFTQELQKRNEEHIRPKRLENHVTTTIGGIQIDY